MTSLRRVAFIGNHLPRRCGIATFTHDLHRSVATARPDLETCVVAMTDPGGPYAYPPAVGFQIRDKVVDDYVKAAEFLNDGGFDVACLQHEYGIFGGPAGRHIIGLLSRLDMPIVTTLHTVLPEPAPDQRDVMRRIIDVSAKLVVMSEKGHEFLRAAHAVPARRIEIIPHGIPDFPFLETHHAKAKFGFGGKTIILTFGLLSPNKGIEVMLDAMPGIIRSCPNVVYVILGATHPHLVQQQGETYRDGLTARVRELGIENHVVFFNQFVEQAMLLDFISMCDVYVTPYLNEAQMTSGTLAYSFGLGKAVVSTPYWHATELLSDGSGILVPFGDAAALGAEIAGLLTDDVRRHAMRERAYAESRSMTWPQTAERYLSVFATALAQAELGRSATIEPVVSARTPIAIPAMQTGHFRSMCDSTGMLQHAVHAIPDRSHGYCVDDNARALLFASLLADSGEPPLPEMVTASFAAFIQHAWNPDVRRFRNFMSYDRRWLEPSGSEDSHARTLWALAECARRDTDPSRRRWAAALFKTALPCVAEFSSPRAWAFALLGLDAYCGPAHGPAKWTPVRRQEHAQTRESRACSDSEGTEHALVIGDPFPDHMRRLLADKLMALFAATESEDWPWFEDVLAYDNARLPQALIQTGVATRTPSYVEVGVRSLRWLMSLQTTSSGHFRPVGTGSFGAIRRKPQAFDQQPVEASAAISACLAAWRADGGAEWPAGAMRAFGWFLGENDLRTTLVDPETGGCSDGLHPDRANRNMGAELALAYLLGRVEIRQFDRTASVDRTKPAAKMARSTANGAIAPRTTPGGILVPLPLLEPSKLVSSPGSGQGRRQTVPARD